MGKQVITGGDEEEVLHFGEGEDFKIVIDPHATKMQNLQD